MGVVSRKWVWVETMGVANKELLVNIRIFW